MTRPPSWRWPRPAVAAVCAAALTVAPLSAVTAMAATDLADSELTLGIASSEDGHGPFSSDGPGGDSSARNGLVRTADAVTWSVSVATRTGTADDVVVELSAVDGASFDRLPRECGAGSSARGAQLTCHLGRLDHAVTVLPVVTQVPQTAIDGSAVRISGEVSAAGSRSVHADSDALVVSAAPRWDLAASTTVPVFEPATGPDGTTAGFRITYPILLHGNSLDPRQGTLGLEQLRGDVSFVDDVSQMYGGRPSPAVLAPRTPSGQACGVNTGEIPGMPAGRGGGDRAVLDSGTILCTQDAPGAPITVSITDIDTTLASVPSKNTTGGPIVGGVKPYAVSGWIALWVPEPGVGESFTGRNVYRDLEAPSLSGQADYPGSSEPLANNVVDRNIGEFEGIVASQRYWGADQGTTTSFLASGKYDQPYVTPGRDLSITATLRNTGTTGWSGTRACTAFDRDVQSLRRVGTTWAVSSRPATSGRPQFAAFHSDDPAQLRDATCDDDETWYDDPQDVPGGPAAVGKVRWTYDHPGDDALSFTTLVQAHADLPDRERLRSFTSIRRAAGTAWTHDRNPADEANGGLADFLTVTADLARVTTKVVDAGHDAADTPDATQYVEAGDVVTLAVYPTVTNATGGGLPDTLVVTDLLPEGSEYVPHSASPTPASIEQVVVDGVTRQQLTWRLPGVTANSSVPPLTFDVQLGAVTGPVVSRAAVVWDRDISDAPRKEATRGLHVLAGAGFTVREDVDAPVHVVRDDVTFTLRHQNLSSSPLPTSSLVTVLPHDGDGRGTDVGGPVVLAAPLQALPGETVRYTSADPASVPGDPEAAGPRWCTLDESALEGCPTSLTDVTAVRIDRPVPVAAGEVVLHDLVVRIEGGRPEARLASDFTFRAEGIATPVTSQTVTTRFVSGAIGDRVWLDANGDGLQDDDEPGLPGVQITLTGTDDRGDAVSATTKTDDEGRYGFDALRPGEYHVHAGRAEHGWTTQHAGDDPAADSDVDADGIAVVALVRIDAGDGTLEGVTRDLDTDAGALPDDGGEPVVEPPVVEPPVDPGVEGPGETPGGGDIVPGTLEGSSSGAGPEATANAAASPRRLAFTGTALTLAAVLAALLAVGGGAVAALRRPRAD